MSKNKIMGLLDKDEYPKNKNLREQIMFHLSFAMMMNMSGRDETAQDHMEKCQSLIELIPDITVEHAIKQYEIPSKLETAISLGVSVHSNSVMKNPKDWEDKD